MILSKTKGLNMKHDFHIGKAVQKILIDKDIKRVELQHHLNVTKTTIHHITSKKHYGLRHIPAMLVFFDMSFLEFAKNA